MEFKLFYDAVSERLSDLFRLGTRGNDAEALARTLLEKYSSVDNAMSASTEELIGLIGRDAALLFKLSGALISRRITDAFAFGKVHTEEEIDSYFKALFLGASVERVYAMCFDECDRVLCCELISSGILNSSEMWPRKIVEVAIRAKAHSVTIAHNHPHGEAEASADDIAQTSAVNNTLSNAGVKLRSHVIVAARNSTTLKVDMDFAALDT